MYLMTNGAGYLFNAINSFPIKYTIEYFVCFYCLFSYWELLILLLRFLYILWIESLFRYMVCKYFIPVSEVILYFLSLFWRMEVKCLWNLNFISYHPLLYAKDQGYFFFLFSSRNYNLTSYFTAIVHFELIFVKKWAMGCSSFF